MSVKKRLFIGLLCAAVGLILILLAFTTYLLVNWEQPVNRFILLILSSFIFIILGIISSGIAGIVLTLWSARTIPSLGHAMRVTINLLFPVALMIGRALGISREKIQGSFIEVNNQLVRARKESFAPGQILVLAPHCLQNSECPHKITLYADNCKKCGKCQVSELLSLRDKYGCTLCFATGGTLARRFVQIYKPCAIIAIACERDLASGIQDTNPLPVLGILNERPHGPCFNTGVDLQKVEEAVLFFLRPRFDEKVN